MISFLFTSAGRRVSFLRGFRKSLNEEGGGKIICTDAGNTSPASYYADDWYKVPRVTAANYIDTLLEICRKEKIAAIIPLIDTELMILAKAKERFAEINTKLIISGVETISISADKMKTANFFSSNNIPHAATIQAENIKETDYPLFFKPLDGSASTNTFKISCKEDLSYVVSKKINGIFQEFINGDEYTVDIWVDPNGKSHCPVARKRLEVRSGEVSKGLTVRNNNVLTLATKIAETLPDAYGCITIQIFESGNNYFANEINPRFGGGYPLAYKAGADYPRWLIQEVKGIPVEYQNIWKENLYMFRYDDEVFVDSDINTIKNDFSAS